MARIEGADLAALAARIRPHDTIERRLAYQQGRFPRSSQVMDLDRRYRFDLLYLVKGWEVLPDEVTDAHIETALRRLVPSLEG